jgi:hypothetical protein
MMHNIQEVCMKKTRVMWFRLMLLLIALTQVALADGLPSTLGGK